MPTRSEGRASPGADGLAPNLTKVALPGEGEEKDSGWVLHFLRQRPDIHITAQITTFNTQADRVRMQEVGVYDGPVFSRAIDVNAGQVVELDGFVLADFFRICPGKFRANPRARSRTKIEISFRMRPLRPVLANRPAI